MIRSSEVSADLVVKEVAHHLAGHLLRVVQFWKLKPEHRENNWPQRIIILSSFLTSILQSKTHRYS